MIEMSSRKLIVVDEGVWENLTKIKFRFSVEENKTVSYSSTILRLIDEHEKAHNVEAPA